MTGLRLGAAAIVARRPRPGPVSRLQVPSRPPVDPSPDVRM